MTMLQENHAVDSDVRSLKAPEIDWGWREAAYSSRWHESIFTLMARYLQDGASEKRVLEIGAGGSPTLGSIAERLHYRAIGLEPDGDGLQATSSFAKSMNVAVGLVRGDGFSLPFANGRFDVVYSLGLIEHFPEAESEALVAEHVRVCRPGGKVVISVPNKWNLPHTLRKAFLGRRYPYYPERSYSPAELRATLESNGLRVVARDGILPLWGLEMMRFGWIVAALLKRLGMGDDFSSPALRSNFGYMTFVVGERV